MKRLMINKGINYTLFDKHVFELISKGYIELVYPFEELRKDDLIELTIYGKEVPIYKKGKVDFYDDHVIQSASEEYYKVDIVRLFKKSPDRRKKIKKTS